MIQCSLQHQNASCSQSLSEESYESNSLSLNENKTKVLVFERNEVRTEYKISVNGKKLEQVNKVLYLKRIFSRDGRYEMDTERRTVSGNRVKGALAVLMRHQKDSTAVGLAVHNAVLVPMLLYGCET